MPATTCCWPLTTLRNCNFSPVFALCSATAHLPMSWTDGFMTSFISTHPPSIFVGSSALADRLTTAVEAAPAANNIRAWRRPPA
uniref:Uncharacterized protein n=1 Tax=Setaria italica TaxID=4555 RepID=K3ZKM8_SETIT